ncbi:preprotein translocase subunit SecE [Peptococcaceae bacterium]|nr:preprotein translocase subunit SecE [Peptococcaceae bacterium]MCL0107824.1 preprotein translocase subunit SecE [Peptococcaceae bacterium]
MLFLKKQASSEGGSILDKAKQMVNKKDDNKASKSSASKKGARGFFGSIKDFLIGVKIELKKVYWPTRRETMIYTVVVLGTVAFVMLLIWLFDDVLTYALSIIIN